MTKFIDLIDLHLTEQPSAEVYYLEPLLEPNPSEEGISVLSMKVNKKLLNLTKFQVSSNMLNSNKKDMQIIGIDHERLMHMMQQVLHSEMDISEEKEVFRVMSEYGAINEAEKMTKLQRWLNKHFDYFPMIELKSADDFISMINKKASELQKNLRIESPDFIIVSSKVNSILSDSPYFKYIETGCISRMGSVQIYMTGTIGNIKVFVNPFLTMNAPITVGISKRKGSMNYTGVVMAKTDRVLSNVTMTDLSTKTILTECMVVDHIGKTPLYANITWTDKKYNFLTFIVENIKKKLNAHKTDTKTKEWTVIR